MRRLQFHDDFREVFPETVMSEERLAKGGCAGETKGEWLPCSWPAGSPPILSVDCPCDLLLAKVMGCS